MRRLGAASATITMLLLCLPARLLAEIQLTTIVRGIPNPTFITHSGDGSHRLFILEQGGIITVLRSGESTPTVFLDIHSKVLSGGERGLLGLAFHPLYARNGRFFVYYTRSGDGGLVIAEYRASSDPNIASPVETILLTIPHPTYANHNGGMLAFGPGGYLYIGVGDGGSANDPPNNAQSIEALLGKILRIDVDRSEAGTPYSAPASNPFVGKPGRDEIFAFGLRNPWRFSFDRETSQLWVGDVGQGAREEVDTPILAGGNYGWRIYEGTGCTNNDPSLCRSGNYIAPIFDYTHASGRCSLTGGYVYRGSLGTLPRGTYMYGDYCSGEIFAWDGRAQSLLLDTNLSISSFGEDDQGEPYVVSLSGTVSKIVGSQCPVSIAPASARLRSSGGNGRITVTVDSDCVWTAFSDASWITITGGGRGNENGVVAYSVAPFSGHARVGTITIGDQTFSVGQSQ